jgi:hypothetical protein
LEEEEEEEFDDMSWSEDSPEPLIAAPYSLHLHPFNKVSGTHSVFSQVLL